MVLFWCFFYPVTVSLSFTLPLLSLYPPPLPSRFLRCNSCWIIAGVLQWLKLRPHLWCSVFQRYGFSSWFTLFSSNHSLSAGAVCMWGHCHPGRDWSHQDGNASSQNREQLYYGFAVTPPPKRANGSKPCLENTPHSISLIVGVRF